MPDPFPNLIDCTWHVSKDTSTYTFDIDMLQIPIDGADLFIRSEGNRWTSTFHSWINARSCRFTNLLLFPNPGVPITSFEGPVMTFLSSVGMPATTFKSFPLTIVP